MTGKDKTKDLREVLREKREALVALVAGEPRVIAVWLFGSQADGTATEFSDIDLALLYNTQPEAMEEMGIWVAIWGVLGTDRVDVIDVARVNMGLRARALAGQLLYERDAERVSDFLEETAREYPDWDDFMNKFDAVYFEGMREDYAKFGSASNPGAHQDH